MSQALATASVDSCRALAIQLRRGKATALVSRHRDTATVRALLRLFVRLARFVEVQAAGTLTWPHPGFQVRTAVWVPEDDQPFGTRLARLERLMRVFENTGIRTRRVCRAISNSAGPS